MIEKKKNGLERFIGFQKVPKICWQHNVNYVFTRFNRFIETETEPLEGEWSETLN